MYQEILEKFESIVEKNGLLEKKYSCNVLAKGHTPETKRRMKNNGKFEEQSFKLPSEEYALTKGKEVLVRCKLGEGYGDAFTDRPKASEGELEDIFDLVEGGRDDKAIFFATLNATLDHLGIIKNTIHCDESYPEKCGEDLVEYISNHFGDARVAHIGFQPGHAKACSKRFEGKITDLNSENIGTVKFGRKILDGSQNEKVIKNADVACITGSTIVNGSLPKLMDWCEKHKTEPIIYGVTGKGATSLLNLNGFCPYGKREP